MYCTCTCICTSVICAGVQNSNLQSSDSNKNGIKRVNNQTQLITMVTESIKELFTGTDRTVGPPTD